MFSLSLTIRVFRFSFNTRLSIFLVALSNKRGEGKRGRDFGRRPPKMAAGRQDHQQKWRQSGRITSKNGGRQAGSPAKSGGRKAGASAKSVGSRHPLREGLNLFLYVKS